MHGRGIGRYRKLSLCLIIFRIHRRIDGGIFHIADIFIGHKILFEILGLLGLDPCEIRLIIRKTACHQFDIRTVLIGQCKVPCFAEFSASPGPLLFPGSNMMICHVQKSCLFSVIIFPDKIIIRTVCHIGGGNRNIFILCDIHMIVFVLIVGSLRIGETDNIPLAVVIYRRHILRKYGDGVIIYRYCRVRPPQEGLGHFRAVIQLCRQFDICLIRIQSHAQHALCPEHILDLSHPDCRTSVLIFRIGIFHRIKGTGSVMLRPVELNTSGYPGSRQSH